MDSVIPYMNLEVRNVLCRASENSFSPSPSPPAPPTSLRRCEQTMCGCEQDQSAPSMHPRLSSGLIELRWPCLAANKIFHDVGGPGSRSLPALAVSSRCRRRLLSWDGLPDLQEVLNLILPTKVFWVEG